MSIRIRGVDHLQADALLDEIRAGGRFVFFEGCISLGIASRRFASDIYFLPARSWGLGPTAYYCLLSFLFGWWCLPWGFIYTPLVLWTNLNGGCDVTDEVLLRFGWPILGDDEPPTVPVAGVGAEDFA